MDAVASAREYYRALDDHDYEALRGLLAVEFVQERPDLTLDGRDRFVRFMREERPQKDTTHRVDAVYTDAETSDDDATEVAVRGRLLDADGAPIVRFLDVFDVGPAGIERLDTYTQ
jgi:ketosteroid isomerase-like protein